MDFNTGLNAAHYQNGFLKKKVTIQTLVFYFSMFVLKTVKQYKIV